MKSLGRTTDLLGPYQAGGAFVRRAWARDNAATLENYLAAFIEALRWSLDPEQPRRGRRHPGGQTEDAAGHRGKEPRR